MKAGQLAPVVHRGRPPRAEADARRAERQADLLARSAAIFASSGIRAVTMDQLAERLGLAKVIVYRFFPSRDELVVSILRESSDRLYALTQEPFQGLDHNLDRMLLVTRANAAGCRLVLRHCASDAEYRPFYDKVHDGIRDQVERLLAQRSKTLAADTMRLQLSSHAIAGFMIDATLHWLERDEPGRDREFRDWIRQSLRALYGTWLQASP